MVKIPASIGFDRIAQVSSTQTGYFLPDALGSVRQVVDPQAQLQLAHSYTPFGEELTSSGDFETTFGFAGEQQDASGLLYLRARYLSTSTGCFTSVDPFPGYLNYPASMNPYQYAYNNPLGIDGLIQVDDSQLIHSKT